MTKNRATAVADVTQGLVVARVDIAAPPERVFKALTTEELTKWWGSDEVYRTTGFTIDLRAGGCWRTEGKGADGSTFHVEGEVLEVDPPKRLVQTWNPSWSPGPATTITYTLDALDSGTRVTVRHTGFTSADACDSHADGWTRVLGWLGGHLAPPSRWYLLRLIAPRPTFAQDMTAEERALMGEHGKYWGRKLGEGVVLAYGPVMDPAGAWGLGLVNAKDEAELRGFENGDPVIAANRGFRYEALPIAKLVY
jgi:uncharacterized protein YndB with AHSA1/START domain